MLSQETMDLFVQAIKLDSSLLMAQAVACWVRDSGLPNSTILQDQGRASSTGK